MSKQVTLKKKPHGRKTSQNVSSVLGASVLPDIVESLKESDEAPIIQPERKTLDPSDSPESHSSFQLLNEESPHRLSLIEESKGRETPELIQSDSLSNQNANENQYESIQQLPTENEKIDDFTFQVSPGISDQNPSMNFVESKENLSGGNPYTPENHSVEQQESMTEDKFSFLTEDSAKNSIPPSIEGEVSSEDSESKSGNLEKKSEVKIQIVQQQVIVKENSPELLENISELEKLFESFESLTIQCDPNNQKIYNEIIRFQVKDPALQGFKLALDNFAKKILCQSCEQKVIEIQLECSHKFCIACAKRRIGEVSNWKFLLSDLEMERFKPSCQVCGELYTRQDITTIIKPEIDELIARTDTDAWRACNACGYKKETKDFYSDSCKECYAFDIRNGKVKNYDQLTSHFLEEKGYCHGCKTIRYFVGDCLTSVCCYNHMHCKICLEKDMNKGQCFTCKTPLSTENSDKINKVLKGKCVSCNEECDREILVPKSCCQHSVCSICQINSALYTCLACNAQLSSRSCKFIDEIKQLAN